MNNKIAKKVGGVFSEIRSRKVGMMGMVIFAMEAAFGRNFEI